ncbi:helix-turn-helix domain-containing protein [Cohnella suwonensis]|uniref:Helix-turn-helix domain-containing protein n=1 Tax=Cohnella suwonensis TaxID=696072 RepID=A0ABW0LR44_9BACL
MIHFRHKFKAAIGDSPSRYIQLKRIEAAKEKLSMTTLSVSKIVSECGFTSSSHFRRYERYGEFIEAF